MVEMKVGGEVLCEGLRIEDKKRFLRCWWMFCCFVGGKMVGRICLLWTGFSGRTKSSRWTLCLVEVRQGFTCG